MTQQKKKYLFSALAVLLAALLITGILVYRGGVHRQGIRHEYLSMGTTVSDQIYAKEAVADDVSQSMQKRLSTLDANELSWRMNASYVAKLNQNCSVAVDGSMADWVQTCLDVSKQSGGVFDITVGSLSTLWGIGTEDARVPSDEEIQDAKKNVNWESVSIQSLTQPENGKTQEIRIGNGQFVDLGAVGKGIACDESYTILKESSVDSAIVSVAGSILLYGENPNSSDGTWSVGIRDPQGDANSYCGILSLPEGFVSTSGNYEKVLEVNGKKYHHILDPRTGYPAESGLTSVTVVAPTGLLADALSTACFILGYSEDSLQLLEHYQASAVFITSEGTVYTTGNLGSCLQLTGSAYTLGKETT